MAAALVAVLATTSCSVGRPDADATGEEIYRQLCVRCHAGDLSGRVGPPIGPGSASVTEPDDYIEFTVVNGRGRMPSFSSSLDDEQLDRLIDYIREVQRG
jgi:mono/diheme cytochrome c family protein